jgi:hypothetical protein
LISVSDVNVFFLITDHDVEQHMKLHKFLFIFIVLLFFTATACKRESLVCPEDSGTPQPLPIADQAQSASGASGPGTVDVWGKMIEFDKVVHGSFCDDAWSGSVYVACDVQVAEWVEQPTFLDECSLSIAEGAVVYVADHNNEVFYNGCSCHYSEQAENAAP